eukprot:scaffold2404_cov398-Prasinococcus_capsulatus_cf.AAC.36
MPWWHSEQHPKQTDTVTATPTRMAAQHARTLGPAARSVAVCAGRKEMASPSTALSGEPCDGSTGPTREERLRKKKSLMPYRCSSRGEPDGHALHGATGSPANLRGCDWEPLLSKHRNSTRAPSYATSPSQYDIDSQPAGPLVSVRGAVAPYHIGIPV